LMLFTDEITIPHSLAISSLVLVFVLTKRTVRTTLGQKMYHMSKTNPIRYEMLIDFLLNF
jgi:hypothetical protein